MLAFVAPAVREGAVVTRAINGCARASTGLVCPVRRMSGDARWIASSGAELPGGRMLQHS
jgi:hypothetical protein